MQPQCNADSQQAPAGERRPGGAWRPGAAAARLLARARPGVLASLLIMGAWLATAGIVHGEERFPPPDFQGGHQLPTETYPALSPRAWDYIDVSLLTAALGLAAWLSLRKRSRGGLMLLTLFGVGYFGFFRKGCVCPIGSIQNVTAAAFDASSPLPWVVGAFFVLPIAFSLFFGRVFCSGVCPLGALQDLVSWKAMRVPRWLEQGLGTFAFAYLLLAVASASIGGPFLICQYDPFVSIFRLNGPGHMLIIGGALLLLGLVVGRPYCRFLCPYGALLRITSRFTWKRIAVAPGECIRCHLCHESCPYNAIVPPSPGASGSRSAMRRRFLGSVFVSLLMLAALAGLGYFAGSRFASLHRDVRLAAEVLHDLKTDATRAFADAGGDRRALFDHARGIQRRASLGLGAAGAMLGLIIGRRLLRTTQMRPKEDYTADPSACVACGRCFAACPVELKRRGVILELPVITPAPHEGAGPEARHA